MLGRIRESFERERRFVADASHELRTRLAVMRTELDGALLTRSAEPGVRVALLAVRSECDRLTRLADDLLVLARFGQWPPPTTNHKRADLRPVRHGSRPVRGPGRGIRPLHRARGSFVYVGPGGSGSAATSSEQPAGQCDSARRRRDRTSRRRASDGVDITISDQGPGFPASFTDKAFERFSRADPTRGDTGAGLGLALVQAIAVAHGGRVWISCNAGTTVHLWLPNPHSRLISAS